MLQLTSIYAALCGILSFALSIWVILKRWKLKVSVGTNGHKEMELAVRAHGNFHEYVALALLLIALCEAQGQASNWIHFLGGILVLGRLSHWYGIFNFRGFNFFRAFGMVSTFTSMITASALILSSVFLK